jgi:hypothetical protein
MCWIKIGDWVEALIHTFTLGFGKRISTFIAVDLLGYETCGCEERRIWLNKLTCKENNDGIKIY